MAEPLDRWTRYKLAPPGDPLSPVVEYHEELRTEEVAVSTIAGLLDALWEAHGYGSMAPFVRDYFGPGGEYESYQIIREEVFIYGPTATEQEEFQELLAEARSSPDET